MDTEFDIIMAHRLIQERNKKEMKTRYTTKYKFITGQPNKKNEYYVYRTEKLNKEDEIITAYIMKNENLKAIESIKLKKGDYKKFLNFQEKIEGRKFFEEDSEYYI